MVHITVAIARFFEILLLDIARSAAGVMAVGALALGAVAAGVGLLRRWRGGR